MTRGNLILDSDYPKTGLTLISVGRAYMREVFRRRDVRSPLSAELRDACQVQLEDGGSQSDVAAGRRKDHDLGRDNESDYRLPR